MEFKRRVPWYDFLFSKPKNVTTLSPSEATQEFSRAQKIYQEYVEKQPIDEITASLLENGTMKDRFASYKVMAQDTPLLMLDYLKKLNELMNGKVRHQVDAMNCAATIYIKSLLPNRPLRKFADQVIKNSSEKLLLLFYFEDRLKYYYGEFIKNTERAARAKQNFVRDPAIKTLGELMKEKPENELIILNILVDKFGDPLAAVSQVASHAIHNVLVSNPKMNSFVSSTIKKRMNAYTTEAAKKRALKFLGQLKVQANDKEGASEMLQTVREQLIPLLNKRGRENKDNSKVISSLMRSAEKCAEVCDPKELKELIDPLYIFVAGSSILTALPTLHLLYVLHKAQGEIPAKFYQFFYAFFNNTEFGNSTKQPQVLNFLLDVLKNEKDAVIACNFIHRLLHIGLHMNITFTVSALYFTATIFKERPDVKTMISKVNPALEATYNFSNEAPTNEGATVTFPWILNLYMQHYHPAVRELATKIAKNADIEYNSDPFADFAVTSQLNHIAGNPPEDEPELVKDCFKEFDDIPDFDDDEDDDEENEENKEKEE